MANLVAEHPTPAQLRSFGEGKLKLADFAVIEEHLSSCESCCRALESVPADSFVGRLKHAEQGAFATTADGSAVTLHEVTGIPTELTNHPRYRVLQLVGQGGMGAVYKAEHRRMERIVALKVINPALMKNPATVSRFQQEVRATAKLSHPNIVTAHDADQAGGLHFLVMEYVEGKTLADLLAERGPLPIPEACECIRQAAIGLQHLHEAGLIHRDIKPHNVMRSNAGTVKLLDCGLARFADEAECASAPVANAPGPPGLTAAGTVMGTADYIAPEQIVDARATDIRSDIYSLGCTFYHLLTGKPPFPEGTPADKFKQHAESTIAIPEEWPDELKAIIRKMTAKKPEDRYATPAGVAEVLTTFRRAASVSGRSLPLSQRMRSRRSRSRLAAALLSLAALIAVALIIIKIKTDKGEIVIQTDDPNLEIVTKKGGEIVRIRDPKSGQTWELDTRKLTMRDLEHPEGLAMEVPWRGKVTIRSSGGKVVVMAGPADVPIAREPEFKPLFNGRDLDGWKTDKAKWAVNDGVIIADRAGELMFDRAVSKNFRLRMEIKLMRGTGVVRFRVPAVGERDWNVALMDNRLGMVDGMVHTGREIGQKSTGLVKAIAEMDEWMVLEITAQDEEATVRINGKQVMYLHNAKYTPAPGQIGLLIVHTAGPDDTEMHVRKIEVMELPPGPSPPESAFKTMFNGTDVSAWDLERADNWKFDDNRLICRGSGGMLRPKKLDLREFHLKIEARHFGEGAYLRLGPQMFQTPDKKSVIAHQHVLLSPVLISAAGTIGMDFGGKDLTGGVAQKDRTRPGEWYTLDVIHEGRYVRTLINGEQAAEFVVTEPGALVGLGLLGFNQEDKNGELQIRKIEIKDLSADPNTAAKRLQGFWTPVQAIRGAVGKDAEFSKEDLKAFALEFDKDKLKCGLFSDATFHLSAPDRITIQYRGPAKQMMNAEATYRLTHDILALDFADIDPPLGPATSKSKDGKKPLQLALFRYHAESVPLFNGKNLDGFVNDRQRWTWQGDTLIGTRRANDTQDDLLFRPGMPNLRDFELEFQARTQGHAPVGILFRGGENKENVGLVANGPMLSIGGMTAGGLWNSNRNQLLKVPPAEKIKAVKPDDFNHYVLRCVGKRVTVQINGVTMINDDLDVPKMQPAGKLAWALLDNGKAATVTFREIRLRALTPPQPPESAFRPLFNGKDLTGWTSTADSYFVKKDGSTLANPVPNDYGRLRTTAVYENYELRFQCQLAGHAQFGSKTRAGVALHMTNVEPNPTSAHYGVTLSITSGRNWGMTARARGDAGEIKLGEATKPPAEGNWHDVRVVSQSGRVTIFFNGEERWSCTRCPDRKGHIGLWAEDGEVVFRNVEIKELAPKEPIGESKQAPRVSPEPELLPAPPEKIEKKPSLRPLVFQTNFPPNLFLVRAKATKVAARGYDFTIEEVFAGAATMKGKSFTYVPPLLFGSGPFDVRGEQKHLWGEMAVGGEMLWWVRSNPLFQFGGKDETKAEFVPITTINELEHYQITDFPYRKSDYGAGNQSHQTWAEGLIWADHVKHVYELKTPEERGKMLRAIAAHERPHLVRWAVAMLSASATTEFRKDLLERARRDVLSVEDALLIDRLLCWMQKARTISPIAIYTEEAIEWFQAAAREPLLRSCLETESDAEFDVACRRLSEAVHDHEIDFTLFSKVLDPSWKKGGKLSIDKQWSLGRTLLDMRFDVESTTPFASPPRKPKPMNQMKVEDRIKAFQWLIGIAENAPSQVLHLHALAGLRHMRPFGEDEKKAISAVASEITRGHASHQEREALFAPLPALGDEMIARVTAHQFAQDYAAKANQFVKGPFYTGGWLVPREHGWELPLAANAYDAAKRMSATGPLLASQVAAVEQLDLRPYLTRDPLLKELARVILKERGFFYVVNLLGYQDERLLIHVQGGQGTVRGIMPALRQIPDPMFERVREAASQFINAHNTNDEPRLKELVSIPWCYGGLLMKVIDGKTSIVLYPEPTMGRYPGKGLLGNPGFGPKFPEKLPETIMHVSRYADHRLALLCSAEHMRNIYKFMGERGYVVFLGALDKPGGIALLVRIDKDESNKDVIKIVGTLTGLQ